MDDTNSNPDAVRQLHYNFAKKHRVLIGDTNIDEVSILHSGEIDLVIINELNRLLQQPLSFKALSNEEFQAALTKAYETDSSHAAQLMEGMEEDMDLDQLMQQMPQSEDLLETQDDAPVIRLLNALFTQAIKQKASDIHIETFETRVLVRMRVDGVLQEILEVQRVLSPLLISRVKVMAKLDIAEKRIPQDGRITLKIAGHSVDVRVSTMPSNHGERVVMRLLDKQSAKLDLSLLGMFDDSLIKMRELIAHPHGILLVTGPTGSGKTTSLYAMLTELNQSTRNILTIEDPIEYDLPGIGQTQVNTKVEMTFAKGLRAMLRQDPDVVMIGEIRDLETAEIAVQASLTGHLVLSTLHTNSALGAIARLRDMGVESFLLSSSLIGLIAQRLVRRLCPVCKKQRPLKDDEYRILDIKPAAELTLCEAVGCDACHQSGYLGRTGIYELITIDEKLRSMIHRQVDEQTLEQAVRPAMPSIRHDGFRRVLKGETSIAEVLRVTSQD